MQSQAHYSIFEIAGPIMVGPSSSHTAGACKIGQMSRALFHATPERVTFELHGSFATVYKGHATDRALLAGVMKCKTADPRIKNAFELAKEHKLAYAFKTTDLGPDYHPNTVRITLEKRNHKPMQVTGSSLGGGIIEIVEIDQFTVGLHGVAGRFKTLVVWHDNNTYSLHRLCQAIEKLKIQIHDIETTKVGKNALSIVNLDGRDLSLKEVLKLEKVQGIKHIRSLTKLEN